VGLLFRTCTVVSFGTIHHEMKTRTEKTKRDFWSQKGDKKRDKKADSSSKYCITRSNDMILHQAVKREDLAGVQALLNNPNIDVNGYDYFGKTVLHWAIKNRNW